MKETVVGILVILWCCQVSPSRRNQLVIWNVGQGQFITLASDSSCMHLDVGGEQFPQRGLSRLCTRVKRNSVALTHLDMDHRNFLPRIARSFPNFCLHPSASTMIENKKMKSWQAASFCSETTHSPESQAVQNSPFESTHHSILGFVQDSPHDEQIIFTRTQAQRALNNPSENDLSQVFTVTREVLITGDSSIRSERIWTQKQQPALAKIALLVLGHHGSQTSTSQELVETLKSLRMVVASARKKRYNHPHARTALRVAPLTIIRTENWGHLYFQIPIGDDGAFGSTKRRGAQLVGGFEKAKPHYDSIDNSPSEKSSD